MFPNDRDALRDYYYQAWQNAQQGGVLTPLEQQIVAVIKAHPEYHAIFAAGKCYREKAYAAALGESNPFLHLSLHLSLRDQISTNRPEGIRSLFDKLQQRYGDHHAEHLMMACLEAVLWEAQRENCLPDEARYWENLLALLPA